uniref:Transmembrane protein n=1 Tax=Chromera velia CCMP2878 TaxID=1169474 RepID=A0A0G4HZJ2_9ALVE|eukprot:Cvel_9729.t1-p1 / transcript=Cvel_9729.t1 / gene=Cvel_9729 / organism=Chromera_velia_CCMP2878 / gene_product=hypothetical protein / transcript_product=hypothetical protein / location=Cvel_scaffold568:62868-67045(-) / protein_length=462 / sequence_SO=supercontig / SO=protein_coding / is_pseudo=false
MYAPSYCLQNGWVYIISNTVCGIVASKGVPFAIVSAWITDWAPEEIKMTIISLTFGGMAFLIVAANLTSVLLMSFHVVSEEGLVPMAAVFRVGSVFLIGSFFPSDLPKLDFLNRNSDPPAMQTGETVDSIVTESHSRGQVGIESSESARGAVEGPQGRPLSAMRGSLEVPTARGSIDPSFGGLLEKSLPAPVLSAAASRGNSRLNSQQPSRRVSACKHQEEHGEKEKEKNAEEKEKEKERQSEETLLPHAHRHPGSSCVAVEAAYRLSQLEPADEQPEGEGGGGDDLGSQNENAVDASEDAGETEEGWNLWRDWRRIVDPEVIRRVFEDIHKAWAYLTQKHLLLLIITLLALVADNGFVLVGLLVWIAAVLSLVLAFTVAGRNWRRGSSTNVRQPLLQGAEDVEKGKVERGAVGREEGGPVKIRINVTDLQANTSARTEDEQTEVLLNTPELEQDRTPTPAT